METITRVIPEIRRDVTGVTSVGISDNNIGELIPLSLSTCANATYKFIVSVSIDKTSLIPINTYGEFCALGLSFPARSQI